MGSASYRESTHACAAVTWKLLSRTVRPPAEVWIRHRRQACGNLVLPRGRGAARTCEEGASEDEEQVGENGAEEL